MLETSRALIYSHLVEITPTQTYRQLNKAADYADLATRFISLRRMQMLQRILHPSLTSKALKKALYTRFKRFTLS